MKQQSHNNIGDTPNRMAEGNEKQSEESTQPNHEKRDTRKEQMELETNSEEILNQCKGKDEDNTTTNNTKIEEESMGAMDRKAEKMKGNNINQP